MKTVARLSAEDRSDLFRNTANRMQMSNLPNVLPLSADDLKNLGGDLAENAGGILDKIKDTIGGLFGKK